MTQLTQANTPCRNTKNRAWCFTWNNYTLENIKYLCDWLKNEQYLFGEEKAGTTGTPHLQGVIRFKNARSFEAIKKKLDKCHIEPCKNWEASLNYCSKDGKTFTNIAKKQSRKDRLLSKYDNIIWKDWQLKVIDIVNGERNDRTINWFWEENGNTGKSFLSKYLVLKYDAIISDGKKDNVFNQVKIWLDNHNELEDPKIIILDCPRYNKEYINYGMIEQLKNGLIYSGKYEGGICAFEPPHVIIFANQEPDEESLSKDRWNIIEI